MDLYRGKSMKQSFYVYNNGDLKRKDNTLQFTNYDGEKRDIPIERISDIYVMSEMSLIQSLLIIYRSTEFRCIFLTIIIFIRGVIIREKVCWRGNCW